MFKKLVLAASFLVTLVVGDGIDFCGQDLCFCDKDIQPAEISCDNLKLKSLWEDTDWNVTLTKLNLTSKDPLYVTFTNNLLEHVPRFPPLNITILSFLRNKIKSIEPSAFAELEGLETLNLAVNELSSDSLFEGIFFGKANPDDGKGYFPLPLKHLNISYNFIHSIPTNTFDHFGSLTTIDLGHNPLEKLGGNSRQAIGDLMKLEFLGLSNTSISDLPEAILHDLKHLVVLDLSYNRLKTVPKELQSSHQLTTLSLDGNLFESLDKDSFQGLDSLEDLSICRVRTLRKIEQFTFTPLKNLSKLVIAYNPHLKEIDDGAFEDLIVKGQEDKWPLKDVRLNDNGLTSIDHALMPWESVDYIDIQNNPFRCDCKLGWMVLELVERIRQSNPVAALDLSCSEPKDMKGRSLNDLRKEKELFNRCTSEVGLLIEQEDGQGDSFTAAGITVLIIGVFLVFFTLSIVGFVLLKRRAIAQSLMSPSQIRYERADTEDGSEWRYSQPSPTTKA